MTEWLDEDEHRTWRSVLRMHTHLTTALAQALKTDSDMSISDYEVSPSSPRPRTGSSEPGSCDANCSGRKADWPTTSAAWSSESA